ncbi:hypothetical protein RHSIM_Rhsim01G0030500 [Rhododendron simsii]|uniref:F-box/LRR-repeat protein 15-like leucin rich repeat domain-containing protein n=1 Tax=Rhododendron simsii TaxID=118357 RepID=A0A834HGM1_RHOSS|nr:hypothetical protein RHSIM_Rhsim01G0030500 [Rhododendron simsii]
MSGYFPDDCWELIFQKLREDDERDLDSISLVSKRFLSISNRVKHSLNVKDKTRHLLPSLLTRFPHIKSIVIGSDINKDIDGLINQIARSGVLNLQAVRFQLWCSTEPPRDGFRALALNKKIRNYLKVLDCSGLCSMQDKDLVLIPDLFPRLEELRLRTGTDKSNDVGARITDDCVDALASKLKELKKIVFKCGACFITDKSLISLSTNCVKLRKISLYISSRGPHYVTEDGIDFVVQHSSNLTSLSLKLWSLQHSAFSFAIGNALANAKNLHSLTMTQELFSDKRICLVVKARPPLRKLKLVGFGRKYPEIHGGLKFLLQTCELTLEELTLRSWALSNTGISDLAQYLSNLTSIDLDGAFGLTSATFYTLTKSCPLLEILIMTDSGGQEIDSFSPDHLHKNYQLRHLDISDNMWMNDTMLKNFVQVCPNLQFLGLSRCRQVTNFGIGEVLRGCPVIGQLNIHCLEVSDIFERHSDHSVVNLKTLNAWGTQINDKGMTMIGNGCQNLQYLDIGYCHEVTEKGVMEVVRNCSKLRDINLIGCKKLSTNVLPQMECSRLSLWKVEQTELV